MKEIAEGVYHVGFAELALDEGHNLWEVGFAEILTVEDGRHEDVKSSIPSTEFRDSVIHLSHV